MNSFFVYLCVGPTSPIISALEYEASTGELIGCTASTDKDTPVDLAYWGSLHESQDLWAHHGSRRLLKVTPMNSVSYLSCR